MTNNTNLLTKNTASLRSFFSGTAVTMGISSRADGNMSLSYGKTQYSLRNRRNFLSGLGINYEYLIAAQQVHSGAVRCVNALDRGKGADASDTAIPAVDALITDKPHVPLGIFTADCLSIFLYDAGVPAIGLVHAGWKGTKEQVVINTIQAMQRLLNAKTDQIRAVLGPAIRQCCYVVGEEFKEVFPYDVAERDKGLYFDLAGANKKQLLSAGIKMEHMYDCGVCTCCNSEGYFSYRREGPACGRTLSVIMLAS